jgi:hypothetical protein
VRCKGAATSVSLNFESFLAASRWLAIFALLPNDTRLRCRREVSRAWCSVIAEHSLWARLDLTAADTDRGSFSGAAGGALLVSRAPQLRVMYADTLN